MKATEKRFNDNLLKFVLARFGSGSHGQYCRRFSALVIAVMEHFVLSVMFRLLLLRWM